MLSAIPAAAFRVGLGLGTLLAFDPVAGQPIVVPLSANGVGGSINPQLDGSVANNVLPRFVSAAARC